MYGKYKVDMQGKKIFEGEYFQSEILNERYNDEGIPQLYQNHANCQEEIENMVRFIEIVSQMLHLKKSENVIEDIEKAEGRLRIKLPDVVKALYLVVDKDKILIGNKCRLLELEELFVKDNVLAVLCRGKRKKVYLGIDLAVHHSMLWEENKTDSSWEYEICMESFCEMILEYVAIQAIGRMPFCGTYRIKGYPTSEISACELLEESFQSIFIRFDGYYNWSCAVMLNQNTKTIAWLRTGEFYSDIQIGSYESDVIEQFKKIRGEDGYSEKSGKSLAK